MSDTGSNSDNHTWLREIRRVPGRVRARSAGSMLRYTTLIVLVLVVVAGVLAWWSVDPPDWFGSGSPSDATRDRLVRIAAGIVAIAAGVMALARLDLSRQERALAEQAQLNERFARAVELLGHADAAVKLGALFALEALALDWRRRDACDPACQSIYHVICAFARLHRPVVLLTTTEQAGAPMDPTTGSSGSETSRSPCSMRHQCWSRRRPTKAELASTRRRTQR